MALMKCKECGGKVSTKAAACPSCGAKIGQGKRIFSELFGVIFALIILGGMAQVFIGVVSGGARKTEDELKKELAERCNEAAKSAPQGMDKNHFLRAVSKVGWFS